MVEKKEKQYVSDNAQLMTEWNWDKNTRINPTQVPLGSHKKLWWKCCYGHEWQAAISDRNSGTGCPYCSGNKVLSGYNDLKTVNPTLAKEWDYEKNINLTPSQVMPNSGKKVWWRCNNGHNWQAKVSHRNKGIGCPYCAGQAVLIGENDLYTINPTLSKEWHYEKNAGLTPRDIMSNSGKKVWWKCSKGHEWQAIVANRNKGIGCPICNSERQTSFPEFALVFYLKKYGIDVVHSYRDQGYELDVYIPSKRIAIEYDGYYWHLSKKEKDLEKNAKCEKDGIKLYRIREGLLPLYSSSLDYIIRKNQNDMADIFAIVLSEIVGTTVCIDLEKDAVAIEGLRERAEKENSFVFSQPIIVKEWNFERNGELKPESFTLNSNKKVWWKCKSGHEWQARIADRNKGNGCPYCSGRYAVKGENDLLTLNPSLAKEWNYERNTALRPEDYTVHSSKKIWWVCCHGHEWQAIIKHRANGSDCPYCLGRLPLRGKNDLQTVNPALAKEWNCDKNTGLSPEDVMPNSGKKVWWRCSKGHEWEATISNRNRGNGCPYCSGKRTLIGYNDLQTVNPTLAKEWNYDKNNGLIPQDVTPNSHKKVWWKCSKGHEWFAEIGSRNRGNGCPQCSRKNHKKY